MILNARFSVFFGIAAIACSLFSGNTTAQTINTFAGTGSSSSSGDGGQATAASFVGPMGVATDGSGNVYICDWTGNRVRKVNSSGVITAFAGTGSVGYSGDGGQATAATFGSVSALCTDASGNVYMADRRYAVIRKVNTSGIISTYAGSGSAGYSGDGGPATRAYLNLPLSVVMDASGNLYISEPGNQRIRKVDASGTISTYAGNGSTGFSGDGGPATTASLYNPYGIGLDAGNNLLLVDESNRRVRRVNASTGIINTIAGNGGASSSGDGGPATAAQFNQPAYVIGDASGNIYVTEYAGTSRIRVINTSGVINAFCGSTSGAGFSGDGGPATAARVNWPQGMAMGGGYFYFGDYQNYRVRRINMCTLPRGGGITGTRSICAGTTTTLADTGTGGAWSTSASSIASVNSAGTVFGVTSGTAIISYTLTNSCGSISDTMLMTIIPSPSSGTISGPRSVCASASMSLSSSTSGGIWATSAVSIASVNPTSGLVFGVALGSAIISYTVTNACGTGTDTQMVTVNASPVAGTIYGPTSLCGTASITLGTTGTGGSWSTSSSAIASVSSSGVVNGVSAGTVNITYSVTNGCGTAYAVQAVTVSASPVAGTISGPTQVCTGTPITLTTSGSGGIWGTGSAGIASVSSSGTVTGVAAGTTTISYVVTNACGSAIATYPVTVITTPAVVPIAGPTTLCQGTTISLTDAAAGGTWTTTNGGIASVAGTTGIVYGIGVGTATISYTITNPCGSSFAVVTMNVISTPVLSPITGPNIVCLLSTITLNDTAVGGSWSSSNSALATVSSTGIVTGMTAGTTATITYSKTNMCGTSRVTKVISIGIMGDCTAGIEDIQTVSEISIFPNPNTGAFTLTLPGVKSDVTVSVYDAYGRSVSDRVLTANATGQRVNYDNLARGTYFVRVIADGNLSTHKVVVW